ncbi:hypothetical protein ETD86_07555 [Nonomuraea turkmeniaca]|uniref:Tyr recombinase domain-containing protein n=1 Tax=Nonomuraea turkmeniaca TaxID=103838 RepID=A0A5S4FU72_9ACTN|nr:site-specific integrase [Nonomuraea turkmeniaca]TMR23681.1 hypothetical protein ETD86_07555 [Nonomuraea turkmeniaca]
MWLRDEAVEVGAGRPALPTLAPGDSRPPFTIAREPIRRSSANRVRPACDPPRSAAGLLPDTTLHDLRHGFASTALAEGVPISEVSRWLGHESITTTVDLYGHLVPEASARAREALDKAFRSSPAVP